MAENAVLTFFEKQFGPYTDRLWSAHFALCLQTVEELYDLYSKSINVFQLLVTLHWLSTYPSWDCMSCIWCRQPSTLREHIHHTLNVLCNHLDEIHWEDRLKETCPQSGPLQGVTFSVDVTVFPLTGFKAKDFNWKNFFSVKHNHHCWKFTGFFCYLSLKS
eukprot:TRINITY_DN4908_c0_g1_i1.p1 TRINITY_DN4908_c0_g1~~TRINITY_DN4908_c0_g1_i1.p1  ORF type:complete len:161 (-),score=3.95 TRINITY_DN4908_c0_g1_i1:287-769(-)